MQQVKIFKGVETEVTGIETEINGWIQSTGAKVISITGNIAPQSTLLGGGGEATGSFRYAPSDVIVIVLYEV